MSDLANDIKNFLASGTISAFNEKDFINTIQSTYTIDEAVAHEILADLIADGFITEEDGKYELSSKRGYLKARLNMTTRGYGFCTIEEGKPDIFVANDDLHHAIHGDTVLIRLKQGQRKQQCEVIKILSRKRQNVVGTIIKSKKSCFVIPDDERLGSGLEVSRINSQIKEFVSGQKVVVRFDEDYSSGLVYVIEVLGEALKVGVDILSIIREYNLYEEFPQSVLANARKVAVTPSDEEIKTREDWRNKCIITIDPEDARDLDDGVSLEKLANGTYELGVHIADVSHYVTEGSELDSEAFKRGTSVYFCDRVLPMLPPKLSNNICSLNPQVPRLAMSVVMNVDACGDVLSYRFEKSIISVHRRLTYKTVQSILDGDENACNEHKDITDLLNNMATLTVALEKKRKQRGEVIFDVPEPKIILNEKTGKIADVVAYPHLLSHRIIESFMVLCNEVVAQDMTKHGVPFIYRVHESPDPMRVARLVETLKPFGITHNIEPENPTNFAYQKMIAGLDDKVRPIVSSLALRSMQKAKYSTACLGHFGLASPYYCHFTSPIRRYPDLVIHRIMKMRLDRKLSSHKLEELAETCKRSAEQSTMTEITATEAEREVDNLKKAEFMLDKIGEKFSGIISGITDFGVFVYLPNTVEGLIKTENMPPDNYKFNEKQMLLIGKKRTWRMGDEIEIIVAGVNMPRRQVEFAAAQT